MAVVTRSNSKRPPLVCGKTGGEFAAKNHLQLHVNMDQNPLECLWHIVESRVSKDNVGISEPFGLS